jgi:hypothetical protein
MKQSLASMQRVFAGYFLVVVLILSFSLQCSAAEEYREHKTISIGKDLGLRAEWRATAYTGVHDAASMLPVKLCFSSLYETLEQQCESFQEFDVFVDLKVVEFSKGAIRPLKGVLFLTNSWGMGGGPTSISLWIYSGGKFINLLPGDTYVPALGTFQFFPRLHGKSLLVIASPASYLSGDIDDPESETLWRPHKYKIKIFTYKASRHYVTTKIIETKNKYDPELDIDKIIAAEMDAINEAVK